VLRELRASRLDIIAGPHQGRSVSIFGCSGVLAVRADLRFARRLQQQKMSGALGKVT
jgi:hypothetical protein